VYFTSCVIYFAALVRLSVLIVT